MSLLTGRSIRFVRDSDSEPSREKSEIRSRDGDSTSGERDSETVPSKASRLDPHEHMTVVVEVDDSEDEVIATLVIAHRLLSSFEFGHSYSWLKSFQQGLDEPI